MVAYTAARDDDQRTLAAGTARLLQGLTDAKPMANEETRRHRSLNDGSFVDPHVA
jgi:hypothetical protein